MFVSTKAVGKFEREDITHEYKYPEKSDEEREVMLRALRECGTMFSRYYLNDEMEDIQFNFVLRDDIVIGSGFKVTLVVTNKSDDKEYNISAILRVATMLYTGALKQMVKKDSYEINVQPNSVEEVNLEVSYDEYKSKLEDQAAFNISAKATVTETGFEYLAQDDFRVRMPDIKLEVDGPLMVGEEFSVTASVSNPIPRTLTKCRFLFEGPGLGEPTKVKLPNAIEPGEEATAVCKMTPNTDGEKSIIAKFYSRELGDIDGYLNVTALPRKGENETIY
jgi:transglutaminase 1